MTNNSEQEQVQIEIRYQTVTEFLESTPPNQITYITDLGARAYVGRYPMNTPELQLHCTDDSCNGVRFFRCTDISSEGNRLTENQLSHFYITYRCSNCQRTAKVYSLAATVHKIGEPQGQCYKFGEYPPYGPPVSPRLIKLIGPDRDEFLKGRRCENQGLGIGAFTYYRRVVENQKNRILEEIVKVSEKIGVPQDKIKKLHEAIREIQFKRALEMAKDVMPESLLIYGQSPILLLHRALSRGVHELSDEKCLELARDVRVVLAELSERLSSVSKDETELKKAVSALLNQE